MISRVLHGWWAWIAAAMAALAGLGAVIRTLIRGHRWRVDHTPGPIA